ncbi:MAG: L-threonylcarbamoyladenylate synthase [Kamptonema sp. SIO4C4]|nr:L-threonylcarbamoyladenylate synthase [Kamptonema sp. SIO4C4]
MQTQTAQRSSTLIPEIVKRLEQGETLIIPTDTVYAFIAHAHNADAVNRMAELKQRRSPQPFAIFTHLDRAEEVAILNDSARRMMEEFPYPVTMIVQVRDSVPETVTAGHKNVMVLCPDQFVYDLVSAAPFPITCGAVGYADIRAKSFESAMQLYDGDVPMIVDGGESKYGRSATLVDFGVEVPAILKYGPISYDDLQLILPEVELPAHMRK